MYSPRQILNLAWTSTCLTGENRSHQLHLSVMHLRPSPASSIKSSSLRYLTNKAIPHGNTPRFKASAKPQSRIQEWLSQPINHLRWASTAFIYVKQKVRSAVETLVPTHAARNSVPWVCWKRWPRGSLVWYRPRRQSRYHLVAWPW